MTSPTQSVLDSTPEQTETNDEHRTRLEPLAPTVAIGLQPGGVPDDTRRKRVVVVRALRNHLRLSCQIKRIPRSHAGFQGLVS
jgi:hypothetical protein